MAIQPIDLQNMYSQLSNVAKNVTGPQQTAQISNSVQLQNQAQVQNLETEKVQHAEDNKDISNTVNSEGRNNSGATMNQNKKDNNQDNAESKNNSTYSQGKSYIGTIIDITR